jgi:hypothetical protein
VVLEEKVVGELADRGWPVPGVAPDGKEKLVLGGCETGGAGLLLAPVQETAQTGPDLEEVAVVGGQQRPRRCHTSQ